MYNKLYSNYILKDGGFKKIKTEIDKYVYLLGEEDTTEKTKVYYKPKKISTIKDVYPPAIIYLNYSYLYKEERYRWQDTYPFNKIQRRIDHMKNIYVLDKNNEIVFSERIQKFINEYNKIKDLLKDKNKVYNSIKIPKKKLKNGKKQYRQLYEPVDELKKVQALAKEIIDDVLKIHPHDAVHSYTKKRDNVSNAKMHKYSKHIVKVDLKNYFDTINPTFLWQELSRFKELNAINWEFPERQYVLEQNKELKKDLERLTNDLLHAIINLATYKNGLPQGSPLSPTLSNIAFFRVDHALQEFFNEKNDLSKTRIMYTRYSDDLTFSSFNPIDKNELINILNKFLEPTPFKLNEEKTKYIKNTNRCYITGVKINKDNNATYGHEKKADLKRDIFQLFMMYKEGTKDREHASEVLGQLAYLQKIEPAYAKSIIIKYAKKFNVRPKLFYKYFLG